MRIAYVYDACYPWVTGGVQKRVWELARRLAKDHDVHWYTLHYWEGKETITREGVTLHGVGAPPDLYVDGRRSIREALIFSLQLVEPVLRESFDVVDCQEFPYFPAFPTKLNSSIRNSAFVLTWHEVWGDYWYEYLGRKGMFGKAVERVTTVLPDKHVAVSRCTRNDLQQFKVDDITIVPNGISTAEINAAEASARDIDVLFVGRFIKEKNPRLVVDAVSSLVEDGLNVDCVLLGEGPERESIEASINRHGIGQHIEIMPPRDEYEDVLGLMKAASVLTLPSRREGFGITALEALGCGTPVVTIQHPQNAIEELVIDGKTGAIRPAEPDKIAEGIQLSFDLSAADCTAIASEYDWDRIAVQTEGVYKEVIH